jgi:hypothetical protein
MTIKTKQTFSVILSIIGSIGTVLTTLSAIKVTPKAMEKIDILKKEKGKLSTSDTFRQIVPVYIPTIVLGLATISSIVSSTILSRKAEASLASMALIADQGWRKYKTKIKDIFGIESHSDILASISNDDYKKTKPKYPTDDRKLYWEEHVGFFLATPENVALSYGDINQRIHVEEPGETSYFATIYNFIKQANAEIQNKDLDPENLQWGWSSEYLLEAYGHPWIHMALVEVKTGDGGSYMNIEWCEEPILAPGDYGGVSAVNDDYDPDEPSPFLKVGPIERK